MDINMCSEYVSVDFKRNGSNQRQQAQNMKSNKVYFLTEITEESGNAKVTLKPITSLAHCKIANMRESTNDMKTSNVYASGTRQDKNVSDICDSLEQHCCGSSVECNGDSLNDNTAQMCLCKNHVQFSRTTTKYSECPCLVGRVPFQAPVNRSCEFAMRESAQAKYIVLPSLAQSAQSLLANILTAKSSHAVHAHSSPSIPQAVLALLFLALALAGSLASARGADDVKAATPFSPCGRVSRTTSRQVYSRHPSNCSVFYMCYGSQHWELSCTQNNTVFSLLHSVCVWKGSKYDDCHLPVAGLTTAYAWSRVPLLGIDGGRKFGREVQHKKIDVVVIPSTTAVDKKADEDVDEVVEATTRVPVTKETTVTDGVDTLTTSSASPEKTLRNIQKRRHPVSGRTSESVSDNISQSLNSETSHENIPVESHIKMIDTETLGETRKNSMSDNFIYQAKKFNKQSRPSNQVFAGYSIQYPIFRAERTESRSSVIKSLTSQSDDEATAENIPLPLESGESNYNHETAEALTKPVADKKNAEDVDVESVKLSNTKEYSVDDNYNTQDYNLVVDLPNEYKVNTNETDASLTSRIDEDLETKGDKSEIERREIESSNLRKNEHQVYGNDSEDETNVDATVSLDDVPKQERDGVVPDSFKYRDTYIRDRWPKFDEYGTVEQRTTTAALFVNPETTRQSSETVDDSSVISYQTTQPVEESESTHILPSLLEGRELKSEFSLNEVRVPEYQRQIRDFKNTFPQDELKMSAPSWLFTGELSKSWIQAKRQLLTPTPGFETEEVDAKSQSSESQEEEVQILGTTNEPFPIKNRNQEKLYGSRSDVDASAEYRFWYDKLPVGTSRWRTSLEKIKERHLFEGFKHAIPTVSVYKRQDTYDRKNSTYVGHEKGNSLINAKNYAADILSADILNLPGDEGNRLPFGRPWSRIYPRRVESSIFRSTLKPTPRRPTFPLQRKATDNPKLMEQFLRLLNISSRPLPKSDDLSVDRDERVFNEKAKQMKLTDRKTTVSQLLTRKMSPPPRNALPITLRPKTMLTTKKPTFSFTTPPPTKGYRNLNHVRVITPTTRTAWMKDKYVGLLDKTSTSKAVTKSLIPNIRKGEWTTKQSRIIPPYSFVTTTHKSVTTPRITIQKPKGIPKHISKDYNHPTLAPSPRVKPTPFPVSTKPLITSRPPPLKVTPTPRVTDSKPNRQNVQKGNLQQYPVTIKEFHIRSKVDLQKLKEIHLQSLQKSDKQNRLTPKLPQNFITPWYPTSLQVFYQVYPYVNLNNNNNNRNIEKGHYKNLPKPTISFIDSRTTKSSDYLTFKRTNPFTPPPPKQRNLNHVNPKILQTRPTYDGTKYTRNSKTGQASSFKTQAPQISQKKLDILRKMAPQIWNRLIADSRRREAPPKVVVAETTTMQVYVKPTYFGRENEVDVQGSYWWDRNTQGPKYVVPTSPAFTTSTVAESTTAKATTTTTTTRATTHTTRPTTTPTTPTTTTTTTTTTTAPTTTSTTSTTTVSTTPEQTSLMITPTEPDFKSKKLPPFVGPDYIPDYRKEMQDRCGIMGRPLIIGGRKSRSGQWPWQVSLQIITSTTPWHRCGGVLVHSRWVLTAAHCVEGSFYGDIRNWRVVLADYDLDTISGNEIYRDVVRIISHPDYVRTSNFPNDIAMLELDSPVDLTSGDVQTACLPDSSMPLGAGTKCWISGWGETRGSGGNENMMNEVPVDVVSNDECRAMWGKVNIDVLDTQVCLGYGDTGACYGDSGGPLMCEDQGRFYVAGVMSWLINNCSATNFPNVFTRLPNYMDWVYEHLDYFEWLRYL